MRGRLFALLLCISCFPRSQTPPLLVGTAIVDLTPDHPVPLAGYGDRLMQPMLGVHDPVFAKALWLETPETRVCLLTADLIGAHDGIRQELLARLADPRLQGNLIFAASHTHSGPGALARDNPLAQITVGRFDPDFYETTVSRLTDVVRLAEAAKRPACLSLGTGSETRFSRNRRREFYPSPDSAPIDPQVLVLEARDATTGAPQAIASRTGIPKPS